MKDKAFKDSPANNSRNQSGRRLRVAVVTSTRADWGLLAPVVRRLASVPEVEVKIVATNMHLDEKRGLTFKEILADGFKIDAFVEMSPSDDSSAKDASRQQKETTSAIDASRQQKETTSAKGDSRQVEGVATARAMARCLEGMAVAFEELQPDLLLILGDRYEMLAVASAATVMGIPIAHISGGEITEGAIDDNIRHAISKLSSLHFATTAGHRNRLIAMGEQPERVYDTGALGVYNIHNVALLSREQLEADLGITLDRNTLLVTFHVATNDPVDPAVRFRALLDALNRFPESNVILTYPNNDPGSGELISMIEEYAAANPQRAKAVPSLGRVRYLSVLQYIGAVVGNSSSGIVEVPSAHIPTVNIGIRQRGRTASKSVIHCGDDTEAIAAAIGYALSAKGRELARESVNPYDNPATVDMIVTALTECDPKSLLPKKFYDLP